jgi:hypothetical protein
MKSNNIALKHLIALAEIKTGLTIDEIDARLGYPGSYKPRYAKHLSGIYSAFLNAVAKYGTDAFNQSEYETELYNWLRSKGLSKRYAFLYSKGWGTPPKLMARLLDGFSKHKLGQLSVLPKTRLNYFKDAVTVKPGSKRKTRNRIRVSSNGVQVPVNLSPIMEAIISSSQFEVALKTTEARIRFDFKFKDSTLIAATYVSELNVLTLLTPSRELYNGPYSDTILNWVNSWMSVFGSNPGPIKLLNI